MTKPLRLPLALGLLVFPLFAGRPEALTGRVVSIDGKPVAGAVVATAEGAVRTESGPEGAFTLDVPAADRVRLVVRHPDFYEERVTVAPGSRDPLAIRLTPLVRQTAEIAVTALRYPEAISEIPAAQTVLTSDLLGERLAANLVEALTGVPGLAPLGSGGFSLVPSIRGLARSRVLLLVDGCRIVSDRRTGPGASFVSPEDLDRVEILRNPASIFYGSDAIGGVVQMFTAEPPAEDGLPGRLHLGYGTINGETSYGASLKGRRGPWGFYLSVQGLDAEAYRSPLGEVAQSQYGQLGWLGKVVYETEARKVGLSFLGARGTDIGKPTRTSLTKPTWYPRESQNLAVFGWTEKSLAGGELSLRAFADPSFLETRTQSVAASGAISKDSLNRTESTDYGAQISFVRPLSKSLRLTAGLDWFGRRGVRADLDERSYDASGVLSKTYLETSFAGGRRRDLGLYVSADYTGLPRLDLTAGVRWDSIVQGANPGGREERLESRQSPWTGFLAASYRLSDEVIAFADVATAYRTPGLSELFYNGITGRGMIIAQPGLDPERSLSWDAGLKWIGRRVYAAAYAFHYTVDGLIDRYLVAPLTYTYGNVDRALIRGLELEAEVHPGTDWMLFGTFALLEGRSAATEAPVNDIPPARLTLGGRVFLGRVSAEISALLQAEKAAPGPAEIAIPAYAVFSFKASWALRPVTLFLVAGNLTDRTYVGRPDPDAMEEPGRGAKLGVRYAF